jgi:predicted O-linked N-acetylglucosamine transferase (SPINDLY family)
MATIPEALAFALQHHQAGRLPEAEALYREILQAEPSHAEALHLLGLLAHQRGQHDIAVRLIQQAIAGSPHVAHYHNNIGEAYRALERLEEAVRHYRQALALNPGYAEACNNLGNALKDQGQLDDAGAHYHKALALNPGYAEAYNNLGTVLQAQGRLDAAAAYYEKALTLNPALPQAYNNLGTVLRDQGKLAEAVATYQKALALRPDYAEAHNNLGVTLGEQGHLAEAVAQYQKALALKPTFAEAYYNLGNALKAQGKLTEAEAHYQQALALRPTHAEAYINLGNILIEQRKAHESIPYYRKALELKTNSPVAYLNLAGVLQELGETEEARAVYEQALALRLNDGLRIKRATLLPVILESREQLAALRQQYEANLTALLEQDLTLRDPVQEAGETSFYLNYHFGNDRALQVKLAQVYERACPSLLYTAPHCQGSPAPVAGRKIRVGFLSRFFCNHSIGNWMRGLIAHLSRREFEVLVFSFPRQADEISTFIAQAADRFIECPPRLDAARHRVAQEELDILCYTDIGMEPLSYYLAFARLAPVQCAMLGHGVTTGIPTMDYFLSHAILEPPHAETLYSERVVRLSHLPTYYYRPPLPEILLSRADLGLPEDRPLYVCPQSLFKLRPEFDPLLAGILHADSRGEVVLIEGHQRPWTERLVRRFQRTIPNGVARIRFVPRQTRKGFQSLLAAADVLLDPSPLSGGNTTLDALHAGFPIVTLPGETSHSRLTYVCYRQMGVLDCVATSPEEYVALAVRLAHDRPFRAAVQEKLRAATGRLYETLEAVRELEQFFRHAVAAAEAGQGLENRWRP